MNSCTQKSLTADPESGMKPFAYTTESKNANETLLRHGYLGGSPDQPSVAFSVQMFEIYRQVHRVCPRFSLEGLSKVICYLQKVRTAAPSHTPLIFKFRSLLASHILQNN
jgi:hypothetical protein